ncbi:helix-turn-helix domain-containing protein [Paenibacillus caseinilyticus]|uniref:helix-turn-helix domain-containing protein n=1 Tax=Paenibacillus caseinilyticus TaxID=3098138 RepID=UPI0022B8C46E|nr:helix-turn-helix domain-containing protein [Paenibacillus caseinilyticus]MCZ8518232.1 helix-turn-helix domain-containing protein [Paenibacillus caseinilyticus]
MFGTLMYVMGTKIVNEEIDRASRSSISQLKDQVDLILQQVEQFSGQFSLQSNSMEYMNIQESPSLLSLSLTNTLRDDLSQFVNSQHVVDSAYLYHLKQQVVLTPEVVTSLREEDRVHWLGAFTDTGWIPGLTEAAEMRKQHYWIGPRRLPSGGSGERNVLTYVRLLPLFYNEPKAALVVNVKANFIADLIRSFPLGTEGALYVFSKDGGLITRTGSMENLTEDDSDRLLSWTTGQPEAPVNRTRTWRLSSGRDVFVTTDQSVKHGWTYVMLVPADVPAKNVNVLRTIVVTTTLVLSVLALITAFFSVSRWQKGIQRIGDLLFRSAGPDRSAGQKAHRSQRDPLMHIESQITHLLDEVEEIREQWQEHLPLLRSHYLLSTLLGHSKSLERLSHRTRQEMSVFRHSCYHLLLVEMDEWPESAGFAENERELFLSAVSHMADEILKDRCIAETVMTNKQVAIILNYPEDWKPEALTQAADAIREAVHRFSKKTVTIMVSKRADTFEALSISYHEAQQSLRAQWYRAGNTVLSAASETLPAASVSYPAEIEQQLLEAVREGQAEQASRELHDFFQAIHRGSMPQGLQKTFHLQLLVSVMRLLQEYHIADVVFRERNLYEELHFIDNGPRVREWFEHNLLLPAIEAMHSVKNRRSQEMIKRALAIIEERYAEDLSLQLTADLLQVNSYQLSKLFKSHMGENFIQYVTQYRVNRVKEHLVQTELTIAQIAESVGYSNSQQLIRVFKKLEGMTPGEYRQKQNQ